MSYEKKLVAALVNKYKTNDPFELCEKFDMRVEFRYLGLLRGLYISIEDISSIFINNNQSYDDSRSICRSEERRV